MKIFKSSIRRRNTEIGGTTANGENKPQLTVFGETGLLGSFHFNASGKMLIEPINKRGSWILWLWYGCGCVLLAGYYFQFAIPALFCNFAPDDMMNLHNYWYDGPWKFILANIKVWTAYYRPLGGMYYLPLYSLFGLNPFPYRVVSMILLGVNAYLVYRLAAHILRSRGQAFLVCFLVIYHHGLGNLFYSSSFIYDILCGTFYLLAFLYYVSRREKQPFLKPLQCGIFLCLYVLALNAKEMAVSLPILVFCYEVLVLRTAQRACSQTIAQKIGSLANYVIEHGKPVLLAGFITLLFIGGKTVGPTAMAQMGPYHPVITFGRFLSSNSYFLDQFSYYKFHFNSTKLLIVWGAILFYAFWQKSRDLKFLWCWIVISPLPIAFLPGRGGACLYLVLIGWAMIVAQLLFDLASAIGKKIVFPRIPQISIKTLLIALSMILIARWTIGQHRQDLPVFLMDGEKTRKVIQEMQSFDFRPALGSKILLINEPFETYDTYFIANLVWNRHDLVVLSQGHVQLNEKDQAQMDYILDFKNGLHIERSRNR